MFPTLLTRFGNLKCFLAHYRRNSTRVIKKRAFQRKITHFNGTVGNRSNFHIAPFIRPHKPQFCSHDIPLMELIKGSVFIEILHHYYYYYYYLNFYLYAFCVKILNFDCFSYIQPRAHVYIPAAFGVLFEFLSTSLVCMLQ